MFVAIFGSTYFGYRLNKKGKKQRRKEIIQHNSMLGQIDVAYTIGSLNNKKIMHKEVGVEEMVVIGRGINQHTIFDDYVRQKNILVLSDKCLYMAILHNIYVSLQIEQDALLK
ncbi:hypothetical protein [Priestia megaterium]|uniref:hypothetical protein n=1 Tax=Priestia megaterium TaxID=1404 RepID=UPI000A6900AC|nr:hypothetical protein [Priestia megaterium]